jgi:small subunit ribosomal protein S6
VLREYELTIIARAELPESEGTKLLGKYEKLMTADGGEILQKSSWGAKKLAFPMKKAFRGNYVNYDFIGTSANLAEMERLMRIDDDVLRYMSVYVAQDVNVADRKEQLAKIAAAAREAANEFRERD